MVLTGFRAASPYLLGVTFKFEHESDEHNKPERPDLPFTFGLCRVQVSGGSGQASRKRRRILKTHGSHPLRSHVPPCAGLIVVVVHRKAAMEVEQQTSVQIKPTGLLGWPLRDCLGLGAHPYSRVGRDLAQTRTTKTAYFRTLQTIQLTTKRSYW